MARTQRVGESLCGSTGAGGEHRELALGSPFRSVALKVASNG